MAKAGRVYHWKHGWIPVSPEAKAYVAGRGPRPVTMPHISRLPRKKYEPTIAEKGYMPPSPEALKRAEQRQREFFQQQKGKTRVPGMKVETIGRTKITTFERFPEVEFHQDLNGFDSDQEIERQYEVAEQVQKLFKKYPKASREPVRISFSSELPDRTMAVTADEKPHTVTLNSKMFDRLDETLDKMHSMKDDKFGMTAVLVKEGNTGSPISTEDQVAQFRENVLTHELGHVLHMRNRDRMVHSPHEAIMDFANEKVTPRELGFTEVLPTSMGGQDLDKPVRRFQADNLGGKSAYASQDPYEFFAEAFLEGNVLGDQASESGKRAVALAHELFGG